MDSEDPVPLGYPVATQKLSSHQVCQEHYCSVYARVGLLLLKEIAGTQTSKMFGMNVVLLHLHSSYLPTCVQQDPSCCCHQLCCERLPLYLCKACESVCVLLSLHTTSLSPHLALPTFSSSCEKLVMLSIDANSHSKAHSLRLP